MVLIIGHSDFRKIVLSLGGGAFLNRNIRKEISENNLSFWLSWKSSTLIKRIYKNRKRPLAFDSPAEDDSYRMLVYGNMPKKARDWDGVTTEFGLRSQLNIFDNTLMYNICIDLVIYHIYIKCM